MDEMQKKNKVVSQKIETFKNPHYNLFYIIEMQFYM